MIDARELRIGNLVYGVSDRIEQVVLVRLNGDLLICLPKLQTTETFEQAQDCKPIPLTEEWLKRFGFVKLDAEDYFYKLESNMNLQISEDLKMIALSNMALNHVVVKYVHQLQNLVFALTGQELEVKL